MDKLIKKWAIYKKEKFDIWKKELLEYENEWTKENNECQKRREEYHRKTGRYDFSYIMYIPPKLTYSWEDFLDKESRKYDKMLKEITIDFVKKHNKKYE